MLKIEQSYLLPTGLLFVTGWYSVSANDQVPKITVPCPDGSTKIMVTQNYQRTDIVDMVTKDKLDPRYTSAFIAVSDIGTNDKVTRLIVTESSLPTIVDISTQKVKGMLEFFTFLVWIPGANIEEFKRLTKGVIGLVYKNFMNYMRLFNSEKGNRVEIPDKSLIYLISAISDLDLLAAQLRSFKRGSHVLVGFADKISDSAKQILKILFKEIGCQYHLIAGDALNFDIHTKSSTVALIAPSVFVHPDEINENNQRNKITLFAAKNLTNELDFHTQEGTSDEFSFKTNGVLLISSDNYGFLRAKVGYILSARNFFQSLHLVIKREFKNDVLVESAPGKVYTLDARWGTPSFSDLNQTEQRILYLEAISIQGVK